MNFHSAYKRKIINLCAVIKVYCKKERRLQPNSIKLSDNFYIIWHLDLSGEITKLAQKASKPRLLIF